MINIINIINGIIDKFKPEKQIVKEEFTGENLTKFGGVGLLRRLFDSINLWTMIESKISYTKRNNREFSSSEILVPFIYGIILGRSRPTWMKELGKDKVFLITAGLKRFPDPSVISRFLSRITVDMSKQLSIINSTLLLSVRDKFSWIKDLTLDMDSHVSTVYGKQQRAKVGYNPKKKGRSSYHPLICFIGETRDYLFGKMRSGDHHSQYGAWDFLMEAMKRLPMRAKVKRLRADSGFFSKDFFCKLIKKKIIFFIVVPFSECIQKQIHSLHFVSIGKCRSVAEFRISLGNEKIWGRKRKSKEKFCRVVVIRTKVKKNNRPKKQLSLFPELGCYEYQAIATNSDLAALDVWKFYNQRACCENYIKEGIYSYGFDCIPCHNWAGNCLWFELVFLSYNLMNWFKDKATPFFKNRKGKRIKRMGKTLRHLFFEIPGKLVLKNGEYVLQLEQTWPYKGYFRLALKCLS
jgi:hypothetical protein